MSTVYKLDLEIVSYWINYDPKLLEKKIKTIIEENTDKSVAVKKIKADRYEAN